MTEDKHKQADRRIDTRLRDIFDEGFELLGPFFEANNSWDGQSLDDLAFRVMGENYPDLNQDQIYVFVMAARRLHADGYAPTKR
ncbi:MAG: hypothetical protein AAB319_02125 [Pseudomonadota bacterium]